MTNDRAERSQASKGGFGKITEDGLNVLRNRIGKTYPIEQPYIELVTSDSCRHAAQAVGDNNPLWYDEEYGGASVHGTCLAPPSLLYGVAWGSWDMRRGEGLPGVHGLHSGDHWIFYRPLRHGERVSATKAIVGVEERSGAFAGDSVIQTREFVFSSGDDEVIARCFMAAFRVERSEGRERGKYASIKRATYTPDEIDLIDSEITAEVVRGSEDRFWEDTAIGERLQPLVRGPLTVADIIAWVMGMGSPHIRTGQHWLDYRRQSPAVAVPNPDTGIPETVERVHWDQALAESIGLPAAYDYGAQRGAYATHLMTNWIGDTGFLAALDVTYRGVVFLGDTLRLSGEVTHKWLDVETNTGFVRCAIEATTQRGEVVMPGAAIVAMPTETGGPPRFPIRPPHGDPHWTERLKGGSHK